MIGKNEEFEDDSTNNRDNVNLSSEKKKSLEETSSKAKEEVRLCFEQLARVLRTREKQLVRQIEAIHNQQLSIAQSNEDARRRAPAIRINLSERRDLEETILKFGELSSSERNSIDVRDAEPYKIEDYEEAHRDHVTLDKFIENEETPERSGKFDSPASSRDSSLNTSSDAASDHEVTVLVNRNYSESSDGLAEPILPNHERSQLPEVLEARRDFEELRPSVDAATHENARTATPEEYHPDPSATRKKTQDGDKHPKQIQQWLEQILVETETEPTIHEIEQFAEISKSRFKELQFPLET